MGDRLTILVIGAHPDDCSIKAGGIAAAYVEAGHHVTFLSIANGDAGHHRLDRKAIAARRKRETEAVAETLGIDYDVFDIPDGEVLPTLENRHRLIRYIRRLDPDLVLGPRPNDYHPDHRYTAALIRDAAYLLIVPNICSDVDAMDSPPVIGYVADDFEQPNPFSPDVVVSVDEHAQSKFDALHCHESQMYEWLPYTFGILEEVPEDEDARRTWLETTLLEYLQANTPVTVADRFREELLDRYGSDGADVEHAEAVEISEYGAPVDEETLDTLFPY